MGPDTEPAARTSVDTATRRDEPDFVKMRTEYAALKPGARAELRRVTKPEDLLLKPAFYRLCQGNSRSGMQRVLFILPALKGFSDVDKLWPGQSLAKEDDGKTWDKENKKDRLTPIGFRLNQILRLDAPKDIIQFRRLLIHLEPTFHWPHLAWVLMSWDNPDRGKKKLVQDYFRAKYAEKKGGKK